MIIAGLQKLSLVDYPGYLASTIFVQGCNFRCGYCQNPELITLEKHFGFSEKNIFDFITRRKEMIEGVVITGGEPTIYEDLPDLVSRIKEKGFKVKLDTNGANPVLIEKLFRAKLLDYIAMDIKTSFSKYHLVTDLEDVEKAISESICFTMLSTVPYEFRLTCVPGIIDEEDFKAVGEAIKGAKKCCLQQFRPHVTYNEDFQKVRPYNKEDIRGFQGILENYVESVEIRGI
ncbi:MAG: anaerobic ribonucleoside-triphosphate reductase activating protein [Candidatus Omnitrophota bacterium]|nr:anaerobic ribonucleoside-triphosphate reductase activating protein [Candidatus Omnitrophota bacterium]